MKLPQISQPFFKHNWSLIDELLLPYKILCQVHIRIYFLIFTSCEPLMGPFCPISKAISLHTHCITFVHDEKKFHLLETLVVIYILF